MANRCVLGMRIVRLDQSDDDFARVHANPNLEIDLSRTAACPHTASPFLDMECGVQGSLRVILMRDRRSEQRKIPSPDCTTYPS